MKRLMGLCDSKKDKRSELSEMEREVSMRDREDGILGADVVWVTWRN